MTSTVLVAGATGDLGGRISRELLLHDVRLRVLTRPGNSAAADRFGDDPRLEIVSAEYSDHRALVRAASGCDVVVSAISGTRPVIVDAQRALLAAAVAAGVPRFLPSDYSADYRRLTPGTNRNLELRREFAADADAAPIRTTSVLNGMFTELLAGAAPMILRDRKLVLFWSSADQTLDLTTKDDVARVVALVALDPDAPRVVEVAGDRLTARDVANLASELSGERFRLQWAGTTGTLSAMASVGRRLSRDPDDTFPAWQGMQYFVSMFSGEAQLLHVDNDRYGPHAWTSVRDILQPWLASPGAHPA
ncbi:NmrA family NAD(P)-binding protein [Microbacterium sp. NPDC077663]|uniref:NmrA family NAD(P)-binding protein n=1 Tax=Microbacterium sp. NPDC077663 TaxID=3364189 RepID=UPI0037CB62D4